MATPSTVSAAVHRVQVKSISDQTRLHPNGRPLCREKHRSHYRLEQSPQRCGPLCKQGSRSQALVLGYSRLWCLQQKPLETLDESVSAIGPGLLLMRRCRRRRQQASVVQVLRRTEVQKTLAQRPGWTRWIS